MVHLRLRSCMAKNNYLELCCNVFLLSPSAAEEKTVDSGEVVGSLHLLYLMTFNPLGKRAVSYVFCLEDNLLALLPFAELSGEKLGVSEPATNQTKCEF